mgnify:CR=1 FL=1
MTAVLLAARVPLNLVIAKQRVDRSLRSNGLLADGVRPGPEPDLEGNRKGRRHSNRQSTRHGERGRHRKPHGRRRQLGQRLPPRARPRTATDTATATELEELLDDVPWPGLEITRGDYLRSYEQKVTLPALDGAQELNISAEDARPEERRAGEECRSRGSPAR